MNKNAIKNIDGKEYYELLLPVENYNSHSINELQRAIDQNRNIMPISEPQTQVASDTELSNRSTQPATPQNQNITNYSDAEKCLRSICMTYSEKEMSEKTGKDVAGVIIEATDANCIDAETIANVFVDKINACKTDIPKLKVRSTISYIMIELAKREQSKLAADIISQMVEQVHLDDATKILINIEHNTNSKDAENVSTVTKDILSNVEQEIIQKISDHILDMKCLGPHTKAKKRVERMLVLQPTTPQEQHGANYSRAEKLLRSIRMTDSNKGMPETNGKEVAGVIIEETAANCIDAETVANVFVDKINAGKTDKTKSIVRSTISYSMIEIVTQNKSELAGDIISKMVKQEHLDDATKILINIEHNANSKDAENASTITKDILSKVEQEIIQKISDHILDTKYSGPNASAKNRVKEIIILQLKNGQNQNVVNCINQDEFLALIENMASSDKNVRVNAPKAISDHIVNSSNINAAIVANAFVKKIDAEMSDSNKSAMLSTIEDIMIEMVKRKKHKLVGEVLGQMAKQQEGRNYNDAITIFTFIVDNIKLNDDITFRGRIESKLEEEAMIRDIISNIAIEMI